MPPPPDSTLVVLLAPELFPAGIDPAHLLQPLKDHKGRVRALIYSRDHVDAAFAAGLLKADIPHDWLLGNDEALGLHGVRSTMALPGGHAQDAEELALAMSDVIIAPRPASNATLLIRAKDLRKPVCQPGEPLPSLASLPPATGWLDPLHQHWKHKKTILSLTGRFEQFLLEILALQGWARIARCFKSGWTPKAYVPASWETLPQDRRDNERLRQTYEAMDRSALLGSYLHRDIIWIEHLWAALAVLVAVAGSIAGGTQTGPLIEFVLLALIIGLNEITKRSNLPGRWIACRHGAELLRVAHMCLPLQLVPSALSSPDAPPQIDEKNSRKTDFTALALSEAKRAIRDQGLTHLARDTSPSDAADWLQQLVQDQEEYHRAIGYRMASAERTLRRLGNLFFLAALTTVIAHLASFYFFPPSWKSSEIVEMLERWSLIVTAAGPAFAAALHGARTRLGFVHRIALSEDTHTKLAKIREELEAARRSSSDGMPNWPVVRYLAKRASEAMSIENASWHALLRREPDELVV